MGEEGQNNLSRAGGREFFRGKGPEGLANFFRKREVAVASLLIFSAAILGWGFFVIRGNLYGPFEAQKSAQEHSQAQILLLQESQDEASAARLAEMKTKDTDEDGITDFDELYLYQTSPYLKDTDGDGISDPDEIRAGSNPNCLPGQACNSFSGNIGIASGESAAQQPGASVPAPDAQSIRNSLVAAGMSPDALSQIDDNTLIKMYNETIRETGAGNQPVSSVSVSGTAGSLPVGSANSAEEIAGSLIPDSLDVLKNLTPGQIRQLLLENGMDEDTLSQIDDDLLQQFFLQATEEAGQLGSTGN